MTGSRNYQTEAIVLRYRAIGEADRVVTFYSPDLGRIVGVARGVRRPKSRFGGTLEPLNHVQVSLSRGRTLDTITESVGLRIFGNLKADLKLIAEGLYIAELVDTFGDDWAPNRIMFTSFLKHLFILDSTITDPMATRMFEMRLLACCGFLPEFQTCVECNNRLEPSGYAFSPQLGGVICEDCSIGYDPQRLNISFSGMKVVRWLQNHVNFDDFKHENKIALETQREVEAVMRVYLRYVAERELRSTRFLDLLNSL